MSRRDKMVTVWMPVDPDRLVAKLRSYGRGSLAYIEDVEKDLGRQGFAFDPKKIAKLKRATEKYEALWFEIMDGMTTVHVGPPQGKVAPPEAHEFYRRTGKCLVTEDDELVAAESRSRH
jgi:hypothetical protein